MKYTGGFSESIRRELKLFTVANIEDATMKAISIEGKYLRSYKEDDKIKLGYKSSWKNEHKGEAKGEVSSSKEFYYNHCKASGHLSDYCLVLHSVLRPKQEKRKKERYALAVEAPNPHLNKKCILNGFSEAKVARGEVASIDPTTPIHQGVFGEGFYKIFLYEIYSPNCPLVNPDIYVDTLGKVQVGGIVVWSKRLLKFDD
ncbi:hypothetical protein GIB67_000023 [Kingdonia uniflora]|uniref:Uncharacterized protein n=1 Tax=Kingdonia uniflora TaxID=39325 RepID=A0A7J7MPC2_9MAGN|nr:hypothetical protein GIB67_000023 [Kingdonia uniflora]